MLIRIHVFVYACSCVSGCACMRVCVCVCVYLRVCMCLYMQMHACGTSDGHWSYETWSDNDHQLARCGLELGFGL